MLNKNMLDRLPGALEHAYGHFRQAREQADRLSKGPVLTIALSREAGIEATSIAHEVGELLGWPVYDHELLERIAEEMGLRPGLLERVDEKSASWLVERMETFLAKPPITEPAYMEHLIGTMLALAAHGHCVVVGRGSAYLLPAKTTLRVRLTAPRQNRIDATAQTLNLSPKQAAHQVDLIDRQRNEFVRRHFDKDPFNPHYFDLLLNCSRFPVHACATVIVEAAHRMEAGIVHPEPALAGA